MPKRNEQNAKNEKARPFHTAVYCLLLSLANHSIRSREHARWNLPILDFRFWIVRSFDNAICSGQKVGWNG